MATKKNAIESTARAGNKKEAVTKGTPASAEVKKTAVKAKKTPLVKFARDQGKKAAAPAARKTPIPSGWAITPGGIIAPAGTIRPIPTSILKEGVEKAKTEIKKMIDEVAGILTTEYDIKEIELLISFSASGKFLGIGAGGAASIKIKIAPV